MRVVISDTSPVVALNHLGLVDLLHEFFGTVLVPPAVWQELRQRGIVPPGFITSQAPTDRAQVDELAIELDLGESEALALAVELGDACFWWMSEKHLCWQDLAASTRSEWLAFS